MAEFEEAGILDLDLTILILKNKSILMSSNESKNYWLEKVN